MRKPAFRLALGLAICLLSVGAAVSAGCRSALPDSDTPTAPSVPAAASTAEDSGSAVASDPTPAKVTSESDSASEDGAQPAAAASTGQQPAPVQSPPVAKVDAPSSQPRQEAPAQIVPATDSKPKDDPVDGNSVEGSTYTWQDGDRTLKVRLQTDLAVQKGATGSGGDIVAKNAGGGSIVKIGTEARSESDELPVFRSVSGALMTLPGGVLLILDPEWSRSQTDAFFSVNAIELDRVSELGFVPNGFFVETEPGFPSLNLANALAEQDGVEVSSPNWWTETVAK